ncbi:hypothetical protein CCACVL1_04213 [Corchorus capsularis]|uniref:Pentatricopeptide repeat-containing protein n=1 Tax=Corchorus capsularis TaxID=210143 RepID=A0A1R3JUK2_COCAP|nr:hypothetical protein CCACVL1_04213 [Corchorus capsularis]
MAIGFYHKMVKNGLVPSTVTYNVLIDELCAGKRFAIAFEIFDWTVRHDMANTRTYNAIINGFCSVGDTEKAMVLFHKMVSVGPSPTLITYNTLIGGYLKKGNLNNALRLFEMMKESKHVPDEWTYSELISGFCKWGKMDSASSLFREMLECGLSPNQVESCILASASDD